MAESKHCAYLLAVMELDAWGRPDVTVGIYSSAELTLPSRCVVATILIQPGATFDDARAQLVETVKIFACMGWGDFWGWIERELHV